MHKSLSVGLQFIICLHRDIECSTATVDTEALIYLIITGSVLYAGLQVFVYGQWGHAQTKLVSSVFGVRSRFSDLQDDQSLGHRLTSRL